MSATRSLVGKLLLAYLQGLLFLLRGKRVRQVSATDAKKLQQQWRMVLGIADARFQILEADKTFDLALRALGYQGSFVEKFKPCGGFFSNEEALWWAHKLRNRLAHEAGVKVSEADRKRAVNAFAAGLRTLGVL